MKNSKKPLTLVALIIGLSAGFGLLFDQTSQKAMAAPEVPHHAVVILQASTDPTLFVGLLASDSSAGAPTFTEGSSTAQALADLLAAGFRIEHVDGQIYTLVK